MAVIASDRSRMADPGRLKAEAEIYENLALPRWEATRRAYTRVARPQRERL